MSLTNRRARHSSRIELQKCALSLRGINCFKETTVPEPQPIQTVTIAAHAGRTVPTRVVTASAASCRKSSQTVTLQDLCQQVLARRRPVAAVA